MNKLPVCIRPEYTVFYELFDNKIWIHVDIRTWSATVKKKCIQDITKLQELITVPILALIPTNNVKLIRFAKGFNWTEQGQLMLKDGSKAFIYASRTTGE
jgi:hypothetical protein